MNVLEQYIEKTLQLPVLMRRIPKEELGGLSIYIRDVYTLTEATLMNRVIVLVQPKHREEIKTTQVQKNLATLQHVLAKTVVLVLPELAAYQRQRLIEKRINFIIPGKQLFLPDLLIDLKEEVKASGHGRRGTTLIPAAQFVLLYHLLHRDDINSIDKFPLNEVAFMTGYSQTIMTRVVENLLYHQLIKIEGTKQKTIHFTLPRRDLWENTVGEEKLTSPVTKQVFVDALPANIKMLRANATALTEYSDMNPYNQEYYAIHRTIYNSLVKENKFQHANPTEGKYCLEIWKYNPFGLTTHNQILKEVVDPLSLYLSMKDIQDERTQMALEQLIKDMPW